MHEHHAFDRCEHALLRLRKTEASSVEIAVRTILSDAVTRLGQRLELINLDRSPSGRPSFVLGKNVLKSCRVIDTLKSVSHRRQHRTQQCKLFHRLCVLQNRPQSPHTRADAISCLRQRED